MHIFRATAADVGRVADLITRAFHDLPPSRWLVPDPVERPARTRANFAVWITHALGHGHVDVLEPGRAAAVWFDRTKPVPPPRDYAATGRFREMDDTFDAHHPDEPHHHLAFLAVSPEHQRRGLGTRLLRHHHKKLDERDVAAFLEASSPGNVEFYAVSGYRVLGEPYRLPDGPPMWPMWRERVSHRA